MFKINHRGDFNVLEKLLKKILNVDYTTILNRYGAMGVQALVAYTPVDTGATKDSWSYRVEHDNNSRYSRIIWTNSNITSSGTPVVILLQYGHATKGVYVQGVDFVNPALAPIFNELAEALWREVRNV